MLFSFCATRHLRKYSSAGVLDLSSMVFLIHLEFSLATFPREIDLRLMICAVPPHQELDPRAFLRCDFSQAIILHRMSSKIF